MQVRAIVRLLPTVLTPLAEILRDVKNNALKHDAGTPAPMLKALGGNNAAAPGGLPQTLRSLLAMLRQPQAQAILRGGDALLFKAVALAVLAIADALQSIPAPAPLPVYAALLEEAIGLIEDGCVVLVPAAPAATGAASAAADVLKRSDSAEAAGSAGAGDAVMQDAAAAPNAGGAELKAEATEEKVAAAAGAADKVENKDMVKVQPLGTPDHVFAAMRQLLLMARTRQLRYGEGPFFVHTFEAALYRVCLNEGVCALLFCRRTPG